jgi:nucleolar protein 14
MLIIQLLSTLQVNNLHFGGGFVKKAVGAASEVAVAEASNAVSRDSMNRHDIFQDIIMKSKLFKMQRKEQKEEMEGQRELLDKEFDALMSGSALQFRPTKRQRGYADDNDISTGDSAFKDYDFSVKEMMFEAKVQPSDRTKTAEEQALEARERLEQLERARLLRMKGGLDTVDEDCEEIDRALTINGSKNKRKCLNDDEIEDWKPESDRGDGGNGNVETGNKDSDVDSEVSGDEDDDEEWEDDDDDEDEGIEDSDSENEDNDTSPNEELQSNAVYHEGRLVSTEEAAQGTSSKKPSAKKKRRGGAKNADDSEGDDDDINETKVLASKLDPKLNLKMPHNIECPTSMDEFSELIKEFVLCSEDAKALVDRITIWNSVHLPGENGKANRKKMYVFLEILLKYFVLLADALPVNEDKSAELIDQIDLLTLPISKISQDLAESMPAFWGNQVKLQVTQLQKRMRDFSTTGKSVWPSVGNILMMKVLGIIFSTSDFKNAVVAAATLYFAQSLNLCPVRDIHEMSSGLLMCSILLDYTNESKRWIPEVAEFLRSLFSVFGERKPQFSFNIESLDVVISSATKCVDAPELEKSLKWAALKVKGEHNFLWPILRSASKLCEVCLCRQESSSGYPELALPILRTVQSITPSNGVELVSSLVKFLSVTIDSKLQSRESLRWRPERKVLLESLAPKFDVDYVFKKDTGLSKDKLTLKHLTKQAKREHKAVVRELRRDADFLNQEKYKEDKKANDDRKEERHRNFAWVQDQVATMNQHVKKNKGTLTGGGSGVGRKPVIRGNKARR